MKKLIYSLIFMVLFVQNAISQTATGSFTQVPCNSDGIYTVTTTGLALPITYTYYYETTIVTHANVNSATDQWTGIPMSNNGYIYVEATDGNNTAWTTTNYTPTFTFNISATSPVCPATMGTLNATQSGGTGGPFNFEWTDTQTLNTYTGNNISVPVGTYSVLIEDQNSGCVLSVSDTAANVQQLSNVTATMGSTDASCTNGTASAVASGGVPPYTYSWMNGATTPTITGLNSNYYTVTITDAQGCQSTNLGVMVPQSPVITVNTTVTDATCLQSDGSILAFGSGGVPPYTYSWSNGQTGNNATNLTGPDWYTVVATDANGCVGQTNALVNTSTPITVTYTATPSDCNASTGSATITPTGGTPPYAVIWNTSPAQTGNTASNLTPGTYSFQVTDDVGCVRTGTAIIPPTSTLTVTAQGSNVLCPLTTGDASVSVNGTNPPFTYLWSNSATTSQITGVPLGGYSCEVTDALGCTVVKNCLVSSVSDMNVGVITTPVSCIYNSDGAATAQVSGGTPPYTYSYTNGSTNATANGLDIGNYWLTVTDANGCSKSKYFTIGNGNTTTDCYCTIEGTVYLDDNNNCTLDGGEQGIPNIMIHCSSYGYVFTDANGYYSFQVPTGTYTITEQINGYYPLATCQNNGISVSVVAGTGCTTVVDIANDMNIINDLQLVTINSGPPPVPGNNYQQKVIVTNMGTVTENDIQMGYEHDGQLPYVSSSQPNFLQTGGPNHYSIQSGYPTLVPSQSNAILLDYNVPTNIPLGTEIDFYDSVAHVAPIDVNWLLDYSPWNNVNHYEPVVVSSYDPNYKEVHPKGMGPEGYINSQTTEFNYTIHFQNEGTYYAQNIYITDQLDDDLDWTTLVPGYSDYSYTTTVSETGLVTFTFENINLPWKSAFGDALSSGLINYSIKRKMSVPQGTEFTNTADIYFDYNPPITTNTTLNTLNDDVFSSTEEIFNENETSGGISVVVYPVPANDMITFRVTNLSKEETVTLLIVDLMGNVVRSESIKLNEGMTYINQNVTDLAAGNYLTKIQFSNGESKVNKIVLQ